MNSENSTSTENTTDVLESPKKTKTAKAVVGTFYPPDGKEKILKQKLTPEALEEMVPNHDTTESLDSGELVMVYSTKGVGFNEFASKELSEKYEKEMIVNGGCIICTPNML